MSIEQEPNNPVDSGPSKWDEVAALAGQMGKTVETQNLSLEERRQVAIDFLINGLSDGNIDDDEKYAQFTKDFATKSEGLWSRDYAIAVIKALEPDDPYEESEAWSLLDLGMPVEIVLDNADFYQSMLGNKLELKTINDFAEAMTSTEAGTTKFRHDFIDGKMYDYYLGREMTEIYKTGKCDESTLSYLKMLKRFGVSIFDANFSTPNLDLYSWDSGYQNIKQEEVDSTHTTTDLLIQNGLVDGKDYDEIIETALREKSESCCGIMDSMLDHHIEPNAGDEDALYWLALSEKSGHNMLREFIAASASDRQANFDFSKTPIMNAFAKCGDPTVWEYQDPKFRESLKQPVFQEIIMKALSEDASDMFGRHRLLPNRFLFLAQERSILDNMSQNGIFNKYPECKSFTEISQFIEGNYTEKDRLSLFLHYKITGSKSFEKFFDENGEPNSRFYIENSAFLKEDAHFLDPDEQRQVKIALSLPDALRAYEKRDYDSLDPTVKEYYFDASKPKPEFWQALFQKGQFGKLDEILNRQDEIAVKDTKFDEVQSQVLDIYRTLPSEKSRDFFSKFVLDNIDDITVEKIAIIPDLLSKLQLSNAEEVSEHYEEFVDIFLRSDLDDMSEINPLLAKIEDIFIHNNLPYVGKVFKTFQLLRPINKTIQVSRELERGALKGRPLLSDSDEMTSPQSVADFRRIAGSKDTILFGDLLKASMGSNNRDLRNYLVSLQSGANLTERIMGGETYFSEAEQETLKIYAEHLRTIFENTQAGKTDPLASTGDIIKDIKQLADRFSPTSRYSVPDRVVRSFGFMLGIRGCQDMLDRMDRTVLEADARNRATAARRDFKLESGDLIKATSVEYLSSILQNGSVSKEFLNGQEKSDSTPLDSDLNVLPDDFIGSISDGVDYKNTVAAFGKMHCMMVMKGDANSGRSRFVVESEDGTYDPSRYEIWNNDGRNYGIRVGFPSTEIDYFIWDDLGGQDYYGDLERMKHEIAKNGFYIPIVDKVSGELIFTPDDYESARQKMSGLESLGGDAFIPADSPERDLVSSLSLESYTFPNGTTIESTTETIAKSENNKAEVDQKRNAIIEQVIDPVLEQFGLTRKDYLDGDLTEGSAEIIDTGSTGRYSNAPGDGDFDFMMKLDRRDSTNSAKMAQIRNALCEVLGVTTEAIKNGNFRAKHVLLPGLDAPVDIDITFATKTNKVKYSTDVALKEFYSSMTPEKREEVVANVVFAKRFFKAIEAYKPDRGDIPQGGLGGVGIENWILQNGGSFLAAAREFMRVANECGDDFEVFKEKYAVFDYGQNHQGGDYDNFIVHNMSPAGYDKMRHALQEYLSQTKA